MLSRYWAIVGLTRRDEHGNADAVVLDRSPDCRAHDVCVEITTSDDGDGMEWATDLPAGVYRIYMRPYGDEDSYDLNVIGADRLYTLPEVVEDPVNRLAYGDHRRIKQLWQKHGGGQHGPRIEAATIPLERLQGFLEDVLAEFGDPDKRLVTALAGYKSAGPIGNAIIAYLGGKLDASQLVAELGAEGEIFYPPSTSTLTPDAKT